MIRRRYFKALRWVIEWRTFVIEIIIVKGLCWFTTNDFHYNHVFFFLVILFCYFHFTRVLSVQ